MAYQQVDKNQADAAPNAGNSVNDVVKLISADMKALVQGEIELAKAELVPSAKNAGLGAGMFGAAGYFALNAVSLLFIAGALAFAMIFGAPTGGVALGFVCMGVLLFIITGILALVGKGRIDKVKGPEKTIENGKATVEEVKLSIARATADVKTKELERKTFSHPETLR